jgi:ligand-binding SRPBCC domain-containing protein
MIIKTAAIEMARYNKQLAIIGLHPGTVDTNLSKPFQAHVPEHKLFTPQQSSTYLFDNVLTKIGPSDSGYVFAYDGERLPE